MSRTVHISLSAVIDLDHDRPLDEAFVLAVVREAVGTRLQDRREAVDMWGSTQVSFGRSHARCSILSRAT